jgi:hypothetical protein
MFNIRMALEFDSKTFNLSFNRVENDVRTFDTILRICL